MTERASTVMGTNTASVPDIRRLPGEDDFSDEVKEVLALLRSEQPVQAEDDPNGWFHQIRDHLMCTPADRMERWAGFVDRSLRYKNQLEGRPHVKVDPVRVFRTLTDAGVVFAVVGMVAGYLQGAPYPTSNIDLAPRLDPRNTARLEVALATLDAEPLEWDGWEPVYGGLPGFHQLLTSAGMVNVVDEPWGVGGYDDVMADAGMLEVAVGLTVAVASLESVILSKKAMVGMPGRSRRRREADGLHVLMGEETLALAKKYGAKWNLSTPS
ncbi:MAG: hypothetical protein OXS29_00675 [bacterium]|nr:hypothetical protein [bacterium]MDE0290577.1 hypothetical protein [bacterium]MDE0437440.1 hypothetical protein [bacterium]